jgi:hypothetical protein
MMTPELRAAFAEERSTLQDRLVPFLRARLDASTDHWERRYDRWREAERLYRAYRDPDQQDRKTRESKLTEGVEKIVVPYSYATIQSILAFFMSILTERTPIIPVRGDGPMDVQPAYHMEAALGWQMDNMEPCGTLIIFQWLLDAWRYGVGIIKNLYTVREWVDITRQFVTDPMTGLSQDIVREEEVTAYEGNEALNVSPFDWFPDPSRPMSEFQRGEFVFHETRRSWTEMLQRQAEGLYCGIAHIPRGRRGGDTGTTGGGSRNESDINRLVGLDRFQDDADWGSGARTPSTDEGKRYTTLDEGWVWMTPEQIDKVGLGKLANVARTPRLWVFTLANDARVIRGEPANLPGRRFPFECIEPNYDVYSASNVGIIETTRGLQYHLSWLFNARMMAVRKTLNNELVVDPSMIEESDLLDPKPGRLLRLTRAAQNSQSIDKAVFPLPVVDVTASHMQDSKTVREIGEEVTGASRLLMGLSNTGRRAATEVQGQLNLSSGRMKMLAEIVVKQGLQPWAQQMSRNTQVFMVNSLNVRVHEALARVLGSASIEVNPQILQGSFTFPILEGGIPTDKLMEQQIWRELFQTGMQTGIAAPVLQSLNWFAVFVRFLNSMGIRNVGDYLQQPPPNIAVLPDATVQAMQQQGNLVSAGAPGPPGVEPSQSSDGFPVFPNPAAGNGATPGA